MTYIMCDIVDYRHVLLHVMEIIKHPWSHEILDGGREKKGKDDIIGD